MRQIFQRKGVRLGGLVAALAVVGLLGVLLQPPPSCAWGEDGPRPPPPHAESAGPPPPPPMMRGDHDRAFEARRAGEIAPLSQVLARAERDFEGRMLEAELERRGPHQVYAFKLLTPDDSVLKLHYHAITGELLWVRGREAARWYRGDPALFPDRDLLRQRFEEHRRAREAEKENGEERRRWYHFFFSD